MPDVDPGLADAGIVLRQLRSSGHRDRYVDYLRALSQNGWSSAALARAAGVSRQAVAQTLTSSPDVGYLEWSWPLPVPPIPAPPRPARVPIRLDEVTLAYLKALQAVARTVNGATRSDDPRRATAQEYTEALQRQIDGGMTAYMLAKQLGVTPLAITSRLARYGHRPNVPSMLGTEIKGHAAHERYPVIDGIPTGTIVDGETFDRLLADLDEIEER